MAIDCASHKATNSPSRLYRAHMVPAQTRQDGQTVRSWSPGYLKGPICDTVKWYSTQQVLNTFPTAKYILTKSINPKWPCSNILILNINGESLLFEATKLNLKLLLHESRSWSHSFDFLKPWSWDQRRSFRTKSPKPSALWSRIWIRSCFIPLSSQNTHQYWMSIPAIAREVG